MRGPASRSHARRSGGGPRGARGWRSARCMRATASGGAVQTAQRRTAPMEPDFTPEEMERLVGVFACSSNGTMSAGSGARGKQP